MEPRTTKRVVPSASCKRKFDFGDSPIDLYSDFPTTFTTEPPASGKKKLRSEDDDTDKPSRSAVSSPPPTDRCNQNNCNKSCFICALASIDGIFSEDPVSGGDVESSFLFKPIRADRSSIFLPPSAWSVAEPVAFRPTKCPPISTNDKATQTPAKEPRSEFGDRAWKCQLRHITE